MEKLKSKILIFIIILLILIVIILLLKKKKNVIQIDLENGEDGTIWDEEAEAIAINLYNWMDGITTSCENDLLRKIIETNREGFIKIFNAYYDRYGRSFIQDLKDEYMNIFGECYQLRDIILQKAQRYNIAHY